MNQVLVIMGSKSDLNTMESCIGILRDFNIEHGVYIASAHRSPKKIDEILECRDNKEVKVIIAGAGMAAHLPGVIASKTLVPVIGVPMKGSSLGHGLDALLSIVQMPGGIPVGCMAVGSAGAKNAALYAIQILALQDESLDRALALYRITMEMQVDADHEEMLKNL